jgi:hypothetical protein
VNLKKELKKCTIAVAKIANSIEKNRENVGSKIVPNPKPEKKDNTLPNNTTKRIIINSNSTYFKRK